MKKSNKFTEENRIGYFQKNEERESIYIGNLSYKLNKTHISKIFEPYGKVRYVKLVVNPETNKSKGIAFVQLSNKKETAEAVKNLDGKIISGRTVKVSIAKRQENYRKTNTKKLETEKLTAKPIPVAKKVRRRDKKQGLKSLFSYLNK